MLLNTTLRELKRTTNGKHPQMLTIQSETVRFAPNRVIWNVLRDREPIATIHLGQHPSLSIKSTDFSLTELKELCILIEENFPQFGA